MIVFNSFPAGYNAISNLQIYQQKANELMKVIKVTFDFINSLGEEQRAYVKFYPEQASNSSLT